MYIICTSYFIICTSYFIMCTSYFILYTSYFIIRTYIIFHHMYIIFHHMYIICTSYFIICTLYFIMCTSYFIIYTSYFIIRTYIHHTYIHHISSYVHHLSSYVHHMYIIFHHMYIIFHHVYIIFHNMYTSYISVVHCILFSFSVHSQLTDNRWFGSGNGNSYFQFLQGFNLPSSVHKRIGGLIINSFSSMNRINYYRLFRTQKKNRFRRLRPSFRESPVRVCFVLDPGVGGGEVGVGDPGSCLSFS